MNLLVEEFSFGELTLFHACGWIEIKGKDESTSKAVGRLSQQIVDYGMNMSPRNDLFITHLKELAEQYNKDNFQLVR